MKKMMKGLILSTASVLALGFVTLAPATAGAEGNELTVTLANNAIAIGTQAAQSVTVDVNGTTETIAYDMQDGASVRLSAPTGIRFASFISQADYEGLQAEYGAANVEIGTIVVEAENYVEAAFEVGGANVGKLKADKIAMYDETNGILRFCAVIDTLPENVYDVKVYAKSYVGITVDGTTYYGYTDFTTENQRNIDEVATSALYDTNKTWSASDRYLLEDFAADANPDAEPFIVDTSSETWLTDTFGANATMVTYTDDDAQTSTQVTSEFLTEFDATTAGTETARTKSGVLYMNGDVYRGDVLLVSKVIKTKDDLLNWQEHTQLVGEVVESTVKRTFSSTEIVRKIKHWKYTGYVVLGADITLNYDTTTKTGDIVATEEFTCVGNTDEYSYYKDFGFAGTFDGRGYSIIGGLYGAGGLFGGVAAEGVVKNLAIEDAKLCGSTFANGGVNKEGELNLNTTTEWSFNAIIGQTFAGTMEDCLIDCSYFGTYSYAKTAFADNADLTHYTQGLVDCTVMYSCGGNMTNVVIINDRNNSDAFYKYAFSRGTVNNGTRSNVFLFTDKAAGWTSGSNHAKLTYSQDTLTGVTRGLLTDTVSQTMKDALTADVWANLTVGGNVADITF